MSLFTNKTLLITGGTGSFGNAVLNRFLKNGYRRNTRFFHATRKKAGRYAPRVSGKKMPEAAEKD